MAYKRAYSKKDTESDKTDNSRDVVIELDKKKQVTVRKFNNINLVDIREFYIDKDSGEKKPGKKGISLTEETWKKLLEASSEIQDALAALNGASETEPPAKKAKQEEKEEKREEEEEE